PKSPARPRAGDWRGIERWQASVHGAAVPPIDRKMKRVVIRSAWTQASRRRIGELPQANDRQQRSFVDDLRGCDIQSGTDKDLECAARRSSVVVAQRDSDQIDAAV